MITEVGTTLTLHIFRELELPLGSTRQCLRSYLSGYKIDLVTLELLMYRARRAVLDLRVLVSWVFGCLRRIQRTQKITI